MIALIEVTAFEGMGDTTFIKKVSINPEYIVSIEEDNGHGMIHLSNKSVLRVVETRAEIVMLIKDTETSKPEPPKSQFGYIHG